MKPNLIRMKNILVVICIPKGENPMYRSLIRLCRFKAKASHIPGAKDANLVKFSQEETQLRRGEEPTSYSLIKSHLGNGRKLTKLGPIKPHLQQGAQLFRDNGPSVKHHRREEALKPMKPSTLHGWKT